MAEPLTPRPEGLALAASYQPTIHGLTLYSPRMEGDRPVVHAVSDLATALYGPTARVGHVSDRRPPAGHVVACYVAVGARGPALPVLVPVERLDAKVELRCTPGERDAWDEAADAAGVSRSEWLREAAHRALNGRAGSGSEVAGGSEPAKTTKTETP